jgi:hypothetical protein
MLYPGLRRAMPVDWQILQLATSGCEPRLDARENRNDLCEYFNWFAYSRISTAKPDVVVVAQNLHHDARNMDLISRSLLSLGIKKVIFTGPSPHWDTPLPTLVFKLWGNVPRTTAQGLNPAVIKLDKELQLNFRQSDTSRYASMIDHFCAAGACLVYIGDTIKDGITAYDGGHLMPVASLDFARKVLVPEILTAPGIASVAAARVDSKPQ